MKRLCIAFAAAALCAAASAQTVKPAPKPAAKPAARAAARPAKAPEPPLPDATPDQVKAADMVYYGHYECEFNLSVDIVQSPKHSAYVDVKHGKGAWLMKPVLSSTGAIRLEDVRGQTLMVQISSKSMLLNVVTGHRIVDECVSPRQRELIEAARQEKIRVEAEKKAAAEAAAAASAAEAASAASATPPAPTPPAPAPAASS